MSQWIRDDKRLAVYLRDRCRCQYCNKRVVPGTDLDHDRCATIDHVVARDLGGSNLAWNLVTACVACNSSKRDQTIRSWYRKLRTRGVDTARVAARVRRATGKDLKPHRKLARQLLGL